MDDFRLSNVLMDGGSGLNLIYEDTLDKIQLDRSRVEPSYTTFRGIIPGEGALCSRRVTLDVVFDTLVNYTTKELIFHIVPFHS